MSTWTLTLSRNEFAVVLTALMAQREAFLRERSECEGYGLTECVSGYSRHLVEVESLLHLLCARIAHP